MKLKQLTLVLSLTILCTTVFAQKTKTTSASKKGQLIGLNLILADYKSISSFNNASSGKGYSSVKNMSKGLAVSYWRGLTSKVDLSAKIDAIFHDYALLAHGLSNKTEIGLEFEPSINIRPMGDNAKLAPFLTTGVGVGYYTGNFGAYIPAGVGLQLNCSSATYFFVQAQYRFTLTKKEFGDNLLYSFGIAEHF